MPAGPLYFFLRIRRKRKGEETDSINKLPYDVSTISIDEFVGIEECTLAAAFLRVQRWGCKINHFLYLLPITKKSLAEFHHVNPIIICPLRFVTLGATQPVVEIESVDVERYALCHNINVYILKKPSADGHVHSRKNGGALIIFCKDRYFSRMFQISR